MKMLLGPILGTCLLALAAAGSPWDEYLEDGTEAHPVELDEEERVPLFLPEPQNDDCKYSNLEATINGFENDPDQAQTPGQMLRRKIVPFCKQFLEREADSSLPKLDEGLKGRVSFFVGSAIKANGGKDFHGDRVSMPERGLSEGVLTSIERRGTNLESVRCFAEFYKDYNRLLNDCKETHKRLSKFAYVYRLYQSRQKVEMDPKYAPWVRNTIVCGLLINDNLSYGRAAYRLLEARYPRDKIDLGQVAIGCFNRFNPFLSHKAGPNQRYEETL